MGYGKIMKVGIKLTIIIKALFGDLSYTIPKVWKIETDYKKNRTKSIR